MNAPERIWVDFNPRDWPSERIMYGDMPDPYVEYTRADLVAGELARLRADLAKAVEAIHKLRRVLTPTAMELAYAELAENSPPSGAVLFSFMGGGCSDFVTVAEFQEADEIARAILSEITHD